MSTNSRLLRLTGVFRREVEVETGINYREREWTSEPSIYEMELSPDGIRVRREADEHKNGRRKEGKWYCISWGDILANMSAERTERTGTER